MKLGLPQRAHMASQHLAGSGGRGRAGSSGQYLCGVRSMHRASPGEPRSPPSKQFRSLICVWHPSVRGWPLVIFW